MAILILGQTRATRVEQFNHYLVFLANVYEGFRENNIGVVFSLIMDDVYIVNFGFGNILSSLPTQCTETKLIQKHWIMKDEII